MVGVRKDQIKEILIEKARQGSRITYQELLSKLPPADMISMNLLFKTLGDISTEEVHGGRPMLSAVVVNQNTRVPGKGFFEVADALGLKKGMTNDAFFIQEFKRVIDHHRNHSAHSPDGGTARYWLEQYWPMKNRDLSRLFLWFHEGKLKKDQLISDGDRVLFYEVRKHPDRDDEGAQTVFASGTVTSVRDYIPATDQLMGGKRWIFKREVEVDFIVPPAEGVPLNEVKKILGFQGWVQQGFEIKNGHMFDELEGALKARCSQRNQDLWDKEKDGATGLRPFVDKMLGKVSPSEAMEDPLLTAVRKERSLNAHRTLLNQLHTHFKKKGLKVFENPYIDLLVEGDGQTWIVEVKSANTDNFMFQVRHAVAQLREYRYRLNKMKAGNYHMLLLIQTAPPPHARWVRDYLQTEHEIALTWPLPNGFFFQDQIFAPLLS